LETLEGAAAAAAASSAAAATDGSPALPAKRASRLSRCCALIQPLIAVGSDRTVGRPTTRKLQTDRSLSRDHDEQPRSARHKPVAGGTAALSGAAAGGRRTETGRAGGQADAAVAESSGVSTRVLSLTLALACAENVEEEHHVAKHAHRVVVLGELLCRRLARLLRRPQPVAVRIRNDALAVAVALVAVVKLGGGRVVVEELVKVPVAAAAAARVPLARLVG